MHTVWYRLMSSLSILSLVFLLGSGSLVYADSSCDGVLAALDQALQPNICQTIKPGKACYGSDKIVAVVASGAFKQPGNTVSISKLTKMTTQPPQAVGLMVVKTSKDPVKLIALGNTTLTPQSGGQLFTMSGSGRNLLCTSTKSGVGIQVDADHGQTGSLTVNGVNITLHSLAFISVDGGILFDQDPRIGRREGKANPDALLCSGFDSDCGFEGCQTGQRLLWGPFCRGTSFPYIQNGLYRVTLAGQGDVVAGATEYGSNNKDHFAFGRHDVTLPASYTFCWPGMQPGGQGFETIVESKGDYARIDHITMEYLGVNCAQPASAAASSRFGVMEVSNIEGHVAVSALGKTRNLAVGEQARILLFDNRPVALAQPMAADDIANSPVIGLLADPNDGLNSINRVTATPTPTPTPTPTTQVPIVR